MIILKETPKKEASLFARDTSISLEDVIGLSGFKGYILNGRRLYAENLFIAGKGSLVQGPGSISSLDVSLVVNKQAVISFPIKDIKSIWGKHLDVLFILKDETMIRFFRQ